MWKSLCRKTDLVLVMRAWDGQRNHQYCGWLDHWWMWYACCLPYVRLIWLKKKRTRRSKRGINVCYCMSGSMYVIVHYTVLKLLFLLSEAVMAEWCNAPCEIFMAMPPCIFCYFPQLHPPHCISCNTVVVKSRAIPCFFFFFTFKSCSGGF